MLYWAILGTLAAIVSFIAFLRQRSHYQNEKIRNDELLRISNKSSQSALSERKTLLNSLGYPLFLLDSSHTILFANTSASNLLYGRKTTNRNITELFSDENLVQAINKTLENKEPDTQHVVISSPNSAHLIPKHSGAGETAWIIDAAPLKGFGANVTYRIIMQNVTKQHQTAQVRKDFVANASHELRTPLAIIDGYLENLIEDGLLEDTDTSLRFLKIMRKHSKRLTRIVEDMLVISRLESGEAASLNKSLFSINSCIQDVLERLESVIRESKADVQLSPSSQDIQLDADRFYITQVLFNLIENALKQNPEVGLKVKIEVQSSEENIEISITDNGIGIPAVDLPYIFKRFYRVQKHHSQENIKGTGLGLSIVKRAIEAHNGQITATSIPGQETIFHITLPNTANEQ